MSDVANFCNAFPNVEMTFEVQDADDLTASDPVSVIVTLEREDDEQEPDEGWGKVFTDGCFFVFSLFFLGGDGQNRVHP